MLELDSTIDGRKRYYPGINPTASRAAPLMVVRDKLDSDESRASNGLRDPTHALKLLTSLPVEIFHRVEKGQLLAHAVKSLLPPTML